MRLIDFIKSFPDEEACKIRFKQIRDEEKVRCKSCGSTEHWWLETKDMYHCKRCHRRTSLRSGTVMENSKLPFRIWFIAMHVMTSTKKNISALELQRQLGLKYYEPVWCMMHKIRRVMANREDAHKSEESPDKIVSHLKVRSELDDSKKKSKTRKRNVTVLVTAESIQSMPIRGGEEKFMCGHFKLQVLDRRKKSDKKRIDKRTVTDPKVDSKPHKPPKRDFVKFAKQYEVEHPSRKSSREYQAWIKKILGNAHATFWGIYHGVSRKYFQNYLSEFCYKMNRRIYGTNVFERLLLASTSGWNEGKIHGQSSR